MKTSIVRTAGLAALAAVAACETAGPETGPPDRLEVEVSAADRVVGGTLDVGVTVFDAGDRALEGITVTWSASGNGSVGDASTVTDAVGETSTQWTLDVTPGSQRLTLQASALSYEAAVDVAAGPVAALLLTPGVDTLRSLTGTLTLAVGGEDAYGNEAVVPALTWSSSDTTVATVADGVVSAQGPGTVEIEATTGAAADTATITVDTTGTGIAVGGSVVLLGGDVARYELTEPGTYLISVFNTATSPSLATGFRLQGTGGEADATRARIEATTTRPIHEADPMLDGHLGVLEQSRRLVQRLGPPARLRSDGLAPVAAETVGDIRTFRIPDLDADDLCSDSGYIEVTARAAYVGTYGVIWEDTLAPLAGDMDAVWDTVGTEYDQVMHPVLLSYFGDPLAYDDRLDGNGLFFMLFSEEVNTFDTRSVNGFVFSGDFYSRAQCASSDGAEIFYGRVPTVEDTDGYRYDAGEVGDWQWRTRGTVIHEVKHLTSYANKFDVNAVTLEETGLEEATARLAEELFGRSLRGYGQGDNVTYQESIYCERRPTGGGGCPAGLPLLMHKHYSGVNAYLKTPALLSPFGPASDGDASFYGSGWQWVRWAIDQSDLAEADIIKSLVREPSLSGAENLADKVGDRTVGELLGEYTLAFAIDDRADVAPERAALTIPSWDTRDILQGLHDDYAGTSTGSDYYPTAWPLAVQALSGGPFQVDVTEIHGGGASFFELSGMTGPQALELLSESGGTAPATLGLAIVRIQ